MVVVVMMAEVRTNEGKHGLLSIKATKVPAAIQRKRE